MKTLFDNNGTPFSLLQESDVEGKGITGNVGYLRFSNGIQICWGVAEAQPNNDTGKFIYPKPFKNPPLLIATHWWRSAPRGQVTLGYFNETYGEFVIYDQDNNISALRAATCIAIGIWK